MTEKLYSIRVLEYAFAPARPLANYLYGAGDGLVDIVFSFAVITGGGRVILVDTGYEDVGYGHVLGEASGVRRWISPSAALSKLGLAPADVSLVILTHAHFDHVGGMALFPNATFYMQAKELTAWIELLGLPPRFHWLTDAVDPDDIQRAADYARNGRLVLIDGAISDLVPGLDLLPAHDTHTAGSQSVLVRNDSLGRSTDPWAIAGDLVYIFENLTGDSEIDPYYVPIGYAQGSQTACVLAADALLTHVNGERRRVIPFHEARLKTRFPSRVTADGFSIVEIAVGSGDQSSV